MKKKTFHRHFKYFPILFSVVKCPSIKAPSHGMVFPSTCQTPSGVDYKTECGFMCNGTFGFQLKGTPNVSCLESGAWSSDITSNSCEGRRMFNIAQNSSLHLNTLLSFLQHDRLPQQQYDLLKTALITAYNSKKARRILSFFISLFCWWGLLEPS